MTSDKKRILLQIGVFLLISFGLMYAFGWKTYAVIMGAVRFQDGIIYVII